MNPEETQELENIVERSMGKQQNASFTLLKGLYVWAILLSMEVFDFIDIDIHAGDELPEFSMVHVLAHGQNIVAILVLVGAGLAAWKQIRGEKK